MTYSEAVKKIEDSINKDILSIRSIIIYDTPYLEVKVVFNKKHEELFRICDANMQIHLVSPSIFSSLEECIDDMVKSIGEHFEVRLNTVKARRQELLNTLHILPFGAFIDKKRRCQYKTYGNRNGISSL